MKLVDIGALSFLGHFNNGDLKACDEGCWKKRGRNCKGDTWWLKEEMNQARKMYTRRSVEILLRIRGGINA